MKSASVDENEEQRGKGDSREEHVRDVPPSSLLLDPHRSRIHTRLNHISSHHRDRLLRSLESEDLDSSVLVSRKNTSHESRTESSCWRRASWERMIELELS